MENHVANLNDNPTRDEAGQVVGQIPSPPIPLEYGVVQPLRIVVPIWVTVFVVVGATGVGAFFCTYFRTMGWGFRLGAFVVLATFSFAFLSPFVVLASLGRRIRTMLICLAIIALLPPLCAEGVAGAQEWSFVLRSRLTPGKPMSENRWWPFETSHIGVEGGGTYYGTD